MSPQHRATLMLCRAMRTGDWVWGHLGANALAGLWAIADGLLPVGAQPFVEQEVDRWAGLHRHLWEDPPTGPPDPAWEEKVCVGIAANTAHLRRSGHGVIFGTFALRALRQTPALATADVVADLCRLLSACAAPEEARYFGVPHPDDVDLCAAPPPYGGDADLVHAAFDVPDFFPDAVIDGNEHFFSGEIIHGFTHAHALLMLGDMGCGELATSGHETHRRQRVVNRQRPPGDPSPIPVTDGPTPADLTYWQHLNPADFHALKAPFAALALLRRPGAPEPTSTLRTLRPLWVHMMRA